MEKYQEIERSIIKKYKSKIYGRFLHGVKEFNLVNDNDKICVCISGGKDSFLLAKCMQELKRHGDVNFDLVFICMNPGYNEKNLELIKSNAKLMDIDLNIFYASEYKTMMPKLHSDNFEGMELIRPLYYVREHDILRFVNGNNLTFINCACKFTERSEYENNSKRKEIKNLIKELKKVNPNIDYNVFKSTFNVNLNTILGYHDRESKYFFLDDYDEKNFKN